MESPRGRTHLRFRNAFRRVKVDCFWDKVVVYTVAENIYYETVLHQGRI